MGGITGDRLGSIETPISSAIQSFTNTCAQDLGRTPTIDELIVYVTFMEGVSASANLWLWWQKFQSVEWLLANKKLRDSSEIGKFSHAIQALLPKTSQAYAYQKSCIITRVFPFIENHYISIGGKRLILPDFIDAIIEGNITISDVIALGTRMKHLSDPHEIAWQIVQIYRGDDHIVSGVPIEDAGDIETPSPPPSNYVSVKDNGDGTYFISGTVSKDSLAQMQRIREVEWDSKVE